MVLTKLTTNAADTFIVKPRVGISLIGQSASAAALRRMVALSAATDAPLMITGPVGSGKRDVAGAVHAQSDRSSAGFVAIHCATINSAMLSGGILDYAIGGVVFLDEICTLNSALYGHIRRLLDGRNLRVICTTRHNADWLKNNAGMPVELYNNLSVLTLPAPPLRQRRGDIPLLLEAHIQQLPKAQRYTFDQPSLAALSCYHWPENFDEMRKLVGRLARSHPQQRISIYQLPAAIRNCQQAPNSYSRFDATSHEPDMRNGFNLKNHLEQEEVKFLLAALKKNNGVVQRAANMTGINRTTFLTKMRKYGIKAKEA